MFLKQIDLDALQCERAIVAEQDGGSCGSDCDGPTTGSGAGAVKTSDFHQDGESIRFYVVSVTCVYTAHKPAIGYIKSCLVSPR